MADKDYTIGINVEGASESASEVERLDDAIASTGEAAKRANNPLADQVEKIKDLKERANAAGDEIKNLKDKEADLESQSKKSGEATRDLADAAKSLPGPLGEIGRIFDDLISKPMFGFIGAAALVVKGLFDINTHSKETSDGFEELSDTMEKKGTPNLEAMSAAQEEAARTARAFSEAIKEDSDAMSDRFTAIDETTRLLNAQAVAEASLAKAKIERQYAEGTLSEDQAADRIAGIDASTAAGQTDRTRAAEDEKLEILRREREALEKNVAEQERRVAAIAAQPATGGAEQQRRALGRLDERRSKYEDAAKFLEVNQIESGDLAGQLRAILGDEEFEAISAGGALNGSGAVGMLRKLGAGAGLDTDTASGAISRTGIQSELDRRRQGIDVQRERLSGEIADSDATVGGTRDAELKAATAALEAMAKRLDTISTQESRLSAGINRRRPLEDETMSLEQEAAEVRRGTAQVMAERPGAESESDATARRLFQSRLSNLGGSQSDSNESAARVIGGDLRRAAATGNDGFSATELADIRALIAQLGTTRAADGDAVREEIAALKVELQNQIERESRNRGGGNRGAVRSR